MSANVEAGKKRAGQAAAMLVEDGMTVGLGTGSTVAYLLPALAERHLSLRCVSTSPETKREATALGLHVEPFTLAHLDIAIDGADQVASDGWLVKGGGRAHTREKLVALAAARFVVIVDSTKVVERIHAPIPVELLAFGVEATLARLDAVSLRGGAASPDGGIIADFTGPVDDPATLAALLSATPGVVEHGLFAPEMISLVLVGDAATVRRIAGRKRS